MKIFILTDMHLKLSFIQQLHLYQKLVDKIVSNNLVGGLNLWRLYVFIV